MLASTVLTVTLFGLVQLLVFGELSVNWFCYSVGMHQSSWLALFMDNYAPMDNPSYVLLVLRFPSLMWFFVWENFPKKFAHSAKTELYTATARAGRACQPLNLSACTLYWTAAASLLLLIVLSISFFKELAMVRHSSQRILFLTTHHLSLFIVFGSPGGKKETSESLLELPELRM